MLHRRALQHPLSLRPTPHVFTVPCALCPVPEYACAQWLDICEDGSVHKRTLSTGDPPGASYDSVVTVSWTLMLENDDHVLEQQVLFRSPVPWECTDAPDSGVWERLSSAGASSAGHRLQ